VREEYDFTKSYLHLVNAWKPFAKELNNVKNFDWSIKRLRGCFLEVASELWVAAELQKRHHEVKVVHKPKHADLYIGTLGIEVKGATRQGVSWWFKLGNHRQLYGRDYHVLVLVRADENSIPFDCFVLTKEELERYPPYKDEKGNYYIELEESYTDYKASISQQGIQETGLEKRLHLQRPDFKDRWDKISEMVK
jgi:hypothetical protein